MSYEFADRLIELRKAKGMSQEELAQRIGLSRQAVSKWERAESSPDIGNLVALAEIYDLTIDEIVKGIPEEGAEPGCQEDTPFGASEGEAVEVEAEIEVEPEPEADSERVRQGDTPLGASEAVEVTAGTPNAAADDPIANMPPPDPSQRVDIPASFAADAPAVDQPAAGIPFSEQPPVTNVNIDHMHIDPAMAGPIHKKHPKDPLLTFPYPIACTVLFLLAGFIFGLWHPAWIIFLTIPFYYWIVNIIVKDPKYQARHGYFDE